jgi:hypothetical protein
MAEYTDLKFIQKVRKSEDTGDASIAEKIAADNRQRAYWEKNQFEEQEKSEKMRRDYHGGDINEFIAHMSKAEGYARQARFAVDIQLPANLSKLTIGETIRTKTLVPREGSVVTEREVQIPDPDATSMLEMSKNMGRQMNIHCDSISMPGHDLQTVKHTTFGPERVIPVGHGFEGTITASFYADLYLRERHYLEMWQKVVVNNLTHKANYYDDYVGSMRIYQLDNDGNATYGVEATEVYPEQISAVAYDYSRASSIVKLSCEFQYRQWYNLTTDSINSYGR